MFFTLGRNKLILCFPRCIRIISLICYNRPEDFNKYKNIFIQVSFHIIAKISRFPKKPNSTNCKTKYMLKMLYILTWSTTGEKTIHSMLSRKKGYHKNVTMKLGKSLYKEVSRFRRKLSRNICTNKNRRSIA